MEHVRDEHGLDPAQGGVECADGTHGQDGQPLGKTGDGREGQSRSVEHDPHVEYHLEAEGERGQGTSGPAEAVFQVGVGRSTRRLPEMKEGVVNSLFRVCVSKWCGLVIQSIFTTLYS